MAASAQQMIEQAVTSIASRMEANLDAELNRLDNLNDEDLDTIRQQRLKDMRRRQEKTKEWLARGHGEYLDIDSEQDFFKTMKVRGPAAPSPRHAARSRCVCVLT
jgi:hypothetical protein